MNKTIIANKGTAYKGKSTSIKLVLQQILSEFKEASHTAYRFDYKEEKFTEIELSYEWDVTVIVTINGIKIGVESQGDPNSILFKSLPFFVEENCDIILCATRSGGATVHVVDDISNESNYNSIWLSNPRSNTDHDFLNELFVKQVMAIVNKLLGE